MKFTSNEPKLQTALEMICQYAPLYTDIKTLTVYMESSQDGVLSWKRKEQNLTIYANTVKDALFLLGRVLTVTDRFEENLTPRFSTLSTMLDVSRNSVYTLDAMKKFLCQLALMGYSNCYLYMEDTYELPGYPYFGYRRGRYSVEEQKELDDFADALGITIIPCIQTLAHLRTAIRWNYMEPMRDTIDNLMVGEPETVALVEAMIAHFAKTFRSRKIHLGMDEAVGLGTGRYRLYKGYRDHRDILMEHLNTTCKLCDKYGLTPLIWDDMIFRDDTPLMNYYGDSDPITPEQKGQYPENLQFVYWDYDHLQKEDYVRQIKRRGCLKTVFAGGVWKWGSWVPPLSKSFTIAEASVEACCETGVDEIIVTLWGDDGDETPLFANIPGLALFGLLRFAASMPSQTDGMCRLLSDAPLSVYQTIEQLDLIPGMPEKNLEALIPHKLLLYGDMASELFMGSITSAPHELAEHYRKTATALADIKTQDAHMQNILCLYCTLAMAVAARCDAARSLHTAWQTKDAIQLEESIQKLESFACQAEQLRIANTKVWSHESKGQGLEILDLRLGGIGGRCRSLIQRIRMYLDGEISTLTELDEPELPYKGKLAQNDKFPGREAFGEIVTVNTLCHQFSI